MIKIHLTARKFEIDSELEKYVNKKLGTLDKYLPRDHRNQGMTVEVFRDPSGKEDNRYKVTAILRVQGPDLVAETATINPHSAVDIVEQKLKIQIRKYKEKHGNKRVGIRTIINKLRTR